MLKNNNVYLTWLFASFMTVQLVVLRMGNQAGRGYLPEELQEKVYLFLQVAVILGFLSYALIKPVRNNRTAIGTVVTLCLAGAGIMIFAPIGSAYYLVVTGITVYLLGFFGGAVYHRMSAVIADGARAGLCLGVGYSAGIIIQFFLQLQFTVLLALAAVLVIAFASAVYLLTHAPAEDRKKGSENEPPKKISSKTLIICSVITFAMLLFTSYFNSYIHHLQIASGYTDYNAYSWPRLLMVPGIIIFGVIGDIRKGKFLPISTLCFVVVALLNAVLAGGDTYLLNMCLYYIAMCACVAYYNLTFLRLASSTRNPALWSPMGRMIDSFAVIVQFLLSFSTMSAVAVLVIDIAALAVIIVMMALNGDFNFASAPVPAPAAVTIEENAPVPDEKTSGQLCAQIGERYGLTPTEQKVFRELVETDDKQDVIASRMNISVSTLRHHVTSIYKKTGVQTRTGLYKLKSDEN